MTQFKYWFLHFDNKKIAQWNLRTNERKRIKNLVKSPRTILTIYYKFFCETENMAELYDQLINQADQLDESIDAMIMMLNDLFWAMILPPIFSLILPSLSLKSVAIFDVILIVIGKLIWNQAHQQWDQAEQLYNQANNLWSLPGLDGDQNQ